RIAKIIDVELQFDYFQLSEDMIDWKEKPNPELEKEKWLTSKKTYLSPYYRSENNKTNYPLVKSRCMWLFENTIINPNGDVLPCCYISSKKNSWGNLKKDNFESIWYGEKYLYARSMFTKGEAKRVPLVCVKCPIFKHFAKVDA
ncbi:MAG: SPASM domain-containing protein, partial [Candidatus Pacebacteria bacterium]|nr:SPASM domain-containing protein [Candidatus Paceibacterota bacterium]